MAAAFLVGPFIVFSRWRDGLRHGRTWSLAIIDLMFVAPVVWIMATGEDWDVFVDLESLGPLTEVMDWCISFISVMLLWQASRRDADRSQRDTNLFLGSFLLTVVFEQLAMVAATGRAW